MKHNIDLLLERYWDGETSIEDENQLKAYFNSSEIDESHVAYQDLFSWMIFTSEISSPITDDMNLLLEKYWEGETSVREEEVLKAYFKSGKITENHVQFAEMFAYFDAQSQIKYNDEKEVESKPEVKVIHFNFRKWISVAAAAVVLTIGAVFVVNNLKPETHTQQFANINEIEDPEEALRVTKEALALVSKKFRKSQESVRQNMGALEKASIFK